MSILFHSSSTKFFSKNIFILLLLLCANFSAAQGTWVWMHGSSAPNAPANYGTMFIPTATNNPAGMYKPFGWTDNSGKFWVFGGYNSQFFQCYSDLWKFDPVTNQWTWMGGTGLPNSAGIYGTQGVPAPTNRPGARFKGFSWTDNTGNLWLFGGYGYDVNGLAGKLNDLWKFDIITGEWTWMKGANTINTLGSYGTIGIASMTNNPQSRDECAVAWTANTGELWLFGGQGTTGYLNDVWRYSPTTNMWTWMSGSNVINNPPIYIAFNSFNPANTPGSRSCYARWTDSNGKFWLFGGGVNANLYNDIWEYDPLINQWAWKGGIAFGNGTANYGPSCEANNYAPSSRTETLCTWKDSCDRMWFMGGNNSDLINQSTSDVWFFDPSINQYTLVCGNAAVNQLGNYGTMLVPASTNYPTSNCGSLGFTDSNGNFWLFCGLLDAFGNNTNAMWKYTRPISCPHIIFSILPANPNGCAPLPVAFSLAPGGNNFTYNWDFGDPSTLLDVSSSTTPSYTYSVSGTYTVTLIVHCTTPCNPFNDTVTSVVTVGTAPNFSIGNDTTICGPFNLILDAGLSGSSYLWSTGDTVQSIAVTAGGTYGVTLNPNGCAISDSITISNYLMPTLGPDTSLCQGQTLNLSAGIWDSYLWSNGSTNATLNASTTGNYWVEVSNPPCVFRDTINITVNQIPIVNLGPDTMLCPNEILTLDAGNAGAQFAWSTGDTTQTILISSPDYYNVVVSQNNCQGLGTVQIDYFPQLQHSTGVSFCNDYSVDLVGGPVGLNYLWSTGDTSNVITVFAAGTYTVTINNGNCTFRDSIEVSGAPGSGLLFVPNAFTPNNNGLNDEFKAYGDGITSYSLMIFDRWGELVFETDDLNKGWDGNPHGKKTMSNVFVYRIIYRTECSGDQDIEKIGHFSLMR